LPEAQGQDTLHSALNRSPQVQNLAQLQQSINGSAPMVAQRRRMDGLFGKAAQPGDGSSFSAGPGPARPQPVREGSRSVGAAQAASRARIPASLEMVPVNDDLGLGREALSSLPIQRYFAFKGHDGPHWFWIDTDTGALYWRDEAMMHGSITANGIPEWMFVRRSDGFELSIRSTAEPGRWEVVGTLDDEAEQVRMKPGTWKAPERVPKPTGIRIDDDYEMTVEEAEPVGKPSFTAGEKPSPDYQAQAEDPTGDFIRTRIENPLLAQFHLVPIAQGSLRSGPAEYAYASNAVAIAGVLMGDTDRTLVGTHLEPKKSGGATPQGRHTVAWALVRRSIGALTGRTLEYAFNHLKSELASAIPLAASGDPSSFKEADFLLKRMDYPGGLDRLREARLPLDRWQASLAELVNVYIQIYHLSEGALFKGSSKQRGESDAVSTFAASERALVAGLDMPVGVSDLAAHALNLIDAPLGSLPPNTLAYAVHHWVMMLLSTWPSVMKKHGEAITKGFLGQSYSKSDELPTVSTVAGLVAHFGYELPAWAEIEPPTPTKGEAHLAPFTIERLKADFVANVSVFPVGEGTAAAYSTTRGDKTVSVQERVYPLAQMGLSAVDVSDADRPPTRFLGAGQKSHTVAWTLLRADLMAFGAGRLAALLTFLDEALKTLEGESGIAEGKDLAAKARQQLANRDSLQLTLFDWQNYASTLVKWYVHVYQAAKSTSYADPRTHGRPESHGEGPHMAALRRNEQNMLESGKLYDDPSRVIEAALALFDVCIPKTSTVNTSLEATFVLAFDVWRQRLFHAFPKIATAGWPLIYAAVSKVDVGWKVSEMEMRYRNDEMIKKGQGLEHRLGDILKRNGRNQ